MNANPEPKILPPEWLQDLEKMVYIDGGDITFKTAILTMRDEVRSLLDKIQNAEEGTIFPWHPLFVPEVLNFLSNWCDYESKDWEWRGYIAPAEHWDDLEKKMKASLEMSQLFSQLEEAVETMTFLVTPETIGPIDSTWAQKVATVTAVEVTESMLESPESTVLTVDTLLPDGSIETRNMAEVGDWLVTNPGGETYVVSADTFKATYELVENDIYRSVSKPRLIGSPVLSPARMAFRANWGLLYGKRGDFFMLSTQQTKDGEIVATPTYIINRQALIETYASAFELMEPVSNVTMHSTMGDLFSTTEKRIFNRGVSIGVTQ